LSDIKFGVPKGENIKTAASPKKILFVTPPYHCGITEIAGRWIPLTFVYLAGVARRAGLNTEIYDAMTKNHGYPEIEQRFRDGAPDYVACTAITATINDAIKTLELAKDITPGAVTILGGVHPSYLYEEVLNASPAVDYIVIGEGEQTLEELLAVLNAGGDVATVAGIAFRRDDGTIATTARRPLVESLDDLPTAWDLLDWPDYTYHIIPGSRLGAISTSRGCSHDCAFCSQQRFWDKSWRGRDPQRVVDELEHLHRTYGVTVILITDEHPTRDRERWEALLDLLIARELPLNLLMETRAADIIRDADILVKYRKAGVITISIGVETVRQATLDLVRKGMRLEEGKQALELIHEHGIISEASFMLGFPDETPESIKKTMELVQQYNPDNANFLAVTPWPYANMFADLKPFIKVHDYGKYNLVDPVIEPKAMSLLQIDVALADCYRKFYMGKIIDVMTMKDTFKRSILLRATRLFMSSPFVIRKMGAGILGKIGMRKTE
jgi:anaerobic magnesium-protoporphyrin IX monomethyl ester cyclase